MATEPTRLPTLPPEVWHRILRQNNQLTHLWTECRQVCASWRSEVPKIFASIRISDPQIARIYFDFERRSNRHYDDWVSHSLVMTFHSFDKSDRTRCIFAEHKSTIKSYDSETQAYNRQDEKWESFEEHVAEQRDVWHYPLYQIRIKHHVLDTELPDLRWDWQKRELSFTWEGMLSNFYREAKEINKRVQPWVEQYNDALNGVVGFANGKVLVKDVLSLAVWTKRLSRAMRAHRSKVHRERLRRLYQRHGKKVRTAELWKYQAIAMGKVEERWKEAEQLELPDAEEAFDGVEYAYWSDSQCAHGDNLSEGPTDSEDGRSEELGTGNLAWPECEEGGK